MTKCAEFETRFGRQVIFHHSLSGNLLHLVLSLLIRFIPGVNWLIGTPVYEGVFGVWMGENSKYYRQTKESTQ